MKNLSVLVLIALCIGCSNPVSVSAEKPKVVKVAPDYDVEKTKFIESVFASEKPVISEPMDMGDHVWIVYQYKAFKLTIKHNRFVRYSQQENWFFMFESEDGSLYALVEIPEQPFQHKLSPQLTEKLKTMVN